MVHMIFIYLYIHLLINGFEPFFPIITTYNLVFTFLQLQSIINNYKLILQNYKMDIRDKRRDLYWPLTLIVE